ncbi:hypothetical protein [Roseivirga sp. UBA1976]|nr:hypothetical protein [Roseivirga sp. UBA1976]|tara:strand:- start:844 stop:972 length:129 start_codon:yes stop_codon:yes gene_type:complete
MSKKQKQKETQKNKQDKLQIKGSLDDVLKVSVSKEKKEGKKK